MSLLRRSLHIASKQFFYILTVSTVLILTGLIAAVWLSNAIAERKDEIAVWASDRLGYPVKIGSVDMYWLEMFPKLHVHQLQILEKDSSDHIIDLDHLYLGFDLFATLNTAEPVLDEVSLTGLSIGLERSKQGNLQLAGFKTEQNTSSFSDNALQWLAILNELEFNAISVDYLDHINPELSGQYQLDQALLELRKRNWQLNTTISLPENVGQSISVSANGTFDANFKLLAAQWQVNANQLKLKSLPQGTAIQGVKIGDGRLGLQLNGHYLIDSEWMISGDIDLRNCTLLSSNDSVDSPAVTVDGLSGFVEWQKNKQGWQLKANKLALTIAGQPWPETAIQVQQDQSGKLTVEADYLRLSDITSLALLSNQLPEMIATSRPAGDVDHVYLVLNQQNQLESLTISVQDMAVLPWQQVPGATGLSFDLDWHPERVTLDFDSHQLSLYPEAWLEDAVFLDSLNGQLVWTSSADGWHVNNQQIRAWNDDFNVVLDGSVSQSASGQTITDLQLQLQDVVVERWKAYVPQSVLNPAFRKWAVPAFAGGIVRNGTITLKGDLAAFPFDSDSSAGLFDMNLDVEGARLDYAPPWPPLSDVNAKITSNGNELQIIPQTGKVAGYDITPQVITKITNLVGATPQLHMEGAFSGSTEQALALLIDSPLKARFGKAVSQFEAQGQSDIRLSLDIPLTDVNATTVNGTVSFINSTLQNVLLPKVPIQSINGELAFNNKGVSANNISASLFEKQVTINVETVQADTLINIAGELALDTARLSWPDSIPDFINGHAQYLTQIRVSETTPGDFNLAAIVTSDMAGVAIQLPTPLGKVAAETLPVKMTVSPTSDGHMFHQFDYGEILNAAFMPDQNNGFKGEVRFGQGRANLPEAGISIKGQLDTFSLDEWLLWQETQAETEGTRWADMVDSVSMNIGRVSLYQQQFTDLAFSAARSAQDWRISLQAKEAKGNIVLPLESSGPVPLSLDFSYLYLQLPEKSAEVTETRQPTYEKQKLWPGMQLNIQQLKVDDMLLGELHVNAKQDQQRWQIEQAQLKSEVLFAEATGYWQQLTDGDFTQIDLAANTSDLKALLARLNYQQVIEADKANLDMHFNWQDSPMQVSRQKLKGTMSLALGRGQLIDVKPGAAGRIFGLLSLAAIPRRLALDFSDLFGDGFGFSSVAGSFSFNEGIANTQNLVMNGDAATIEVNGPIDIINKTYNQQVKVTPNVSSTLPLAGAVAGGPVGLGVGAAIMLFDKIAENIFDREIVNLISYNYHLTGPWDDPQLNIVKPASP